MEKKALKDICILNMGQSPASSSYNDRGEGLPFYQGNADFGEYSPITRMWCSEPSRVANEGDVLISVRAPIGAMNVASERCCIGRGLAALTPNKAVCLPEYFFYAVQSRVEELKSQGTGSTFKAVGRKVLEETLIPVYSLEEQEQIVQKVQAVEALIRKRRYQIALLDQLVKSRFIEMFGDVIHNNKGWNQEQFAAFAQATDKSKLAIRQSLTCLETLKKALLQQYFG